MKVFAFKLCYKKLKTVYISLDFMISRQFLGELFNFKGIKI